MTQENTVNFYICPVLIKSKWRWFLGPDGPQKVQPITDKVADLQMFIDRAEHDLSSLAHSIKQSPESSAQPMDTTDATPQGPPAVPPKPQQAQTPQQTPQQLPQQSMQQRAPEQAVQQVSQPGQQQMPQQPIMQQAEFMQTYQEQTIEQRVVDKPMGTSMQSQYHQPEHVEKKLPMPGAVQVLPAQLVKSLPRTKPEPTNDNAPPTFLSELKGAEISEGER